MRRFGQIEFDPVSRRFLVEGRTVALDRQCLAIFALLVDEAGRDVDKDRLLEAGWPGRVVHENSLAKAISRLREAMGADSKLLETVHGIGYRLAAETSAESPPPQNEVPVRRRPMVLVAGAVGLAAAGALALFLSGVLPLSDKQELLRGEPADIVGRVLWVDDHPENNADEKRFFEQHKVAVYQVKTSEEALTLLSMYQYRAVISDMNRNGKLLDGFTLVHQMRKRGDRTPFYLYTYVPSSAQSTRLAQEGGQGVATKPKELYTLVLPLMDKKPAGSERVTNALPHQPAASLASVPPMR